MPSSVLWTQSFVQYWYLRTCAIRQMQGLPLPNSSNIQVQCVPAWLCNVIVVAYPVSTVQWITFATPDHSCYQHSKKCQCMRQQVCTPVPILSAIYLYLCVRFWPHCSAMREPNYSSGNTKELCKCFNEILLYIQKAVQHNFDLGNLNNWGKRMKRNDTDWGIAWILTTSMHKSTLILNNINSHFIEITSVSREDNTIAWWQLEHFS